MVLPWSEVLGGALQKALQALAEPRRAVFRNHRRSSMPRWRSAGGSGSGAGDDVCAAAELIGKPQAFE